MAPIPAACCLTAVDYAATTNCSGSTTEVVETVVLCLLLGSRVFALTESDWCLVDRQTLCQTPRGITLMRSEGSIREGLGSEGTRARR